MEKQKENKSELVNGKRYWLGAEYGIYNKDTHSFRLGNTWVHIVDTIFHCAEAKHINLQRGGMKNE